MAEIGPNGSIDPAEDHRHQRGRETAAVANIAKHYKYPQTVGQDTIADNVNFNSHDSSEYAIMRSNVISEATSEPFMLFEFMKIDEDKVETKIKEKTESIGTSYLDYIGRNAQGSIYATGNMTRKERAGSGGNLEAGGPQVVPVDLDIANSWVDKSIRKVSSWFKDLVNTAERDYIGSCALYMPTDIQINDSMVYNEDTRKLGANLEGILDADVDLMNLTTLTDPAVLAAIGAGVGALPFVPGGAAIGAVLAGSLGQIAQTEVQRHLGQVMNPNELARYSQTALRTFTFNWIILPDNEYESDQAAGLIKFFRKSAHAKRTNATVVTVPDHVITSFHGAKDMIQLPPCFIESVNVTYNPNNSSFFKRNNAPVEIGLGITMKEIVPIYSQDVERGF